jgi:hypothetical protein
MATMLAVALAPTAWAHPDTGENDDGQEHDDGHLHPAGDLSGPLSQLDASTSNDLVSSGPDAKVTKNLAVAGRGDRLVQDATTDVWAHAGYAYLGTFNSPCGTGKNYVEGGAVELVDDVSAPGIPIFDVAHPTDPVYVGNLPSVAGSRINDVKVMAMNQGDVLVHSNEPCAGGPGGFEIYDVDDPHNPVHLAHVQTDDVNDLTRDTFGFVDHGVHNNYLFTRDGRDYNAVQVEGLIGDFQVFDITDPASATMVKFYTAADVEFPGIDWVSAGIGPVLDANAYLGSGFGASQNRFLHDHYVTPDGQRAYLANWDAGLILVELGEFDGGLADMVSVAIEPTSEDGEVNSHSVWPTADESIVVEGEEDFAPFGTVFEITSGPNAGEYDAAEGAFTTPISSLPDQTMSGDTAYVGLACNSSDPVPTASETGASIALIQRGACRFDEKASNAIAAGYDGMVVFNTEANGDALVTMGGDAREIPGLFVGHSTGLAIAGVASAGDLVVGATGASVSATVEPNGWSGMRIWDYSDPSNPVLASTFNTVCSANPIHESCDENGTYSSHNVIVEGTKAYISWYADGVVVLDIADPYAPKEVARYHEDSDAFRQQNGGIQDVWGVYKVPDEPWVYASDRNGGLYVLKEFGAGSEKAPAGKPGRGNAGGKGGG